ncbi:MAG: TROVE domain-containing protein [Hyphomonadaceae bacterium]|nr:TROVE domain-containing protein [Hyphomonadaceae bacterium]
MARTNVAPKFTETTHEGAPAARVSDMQALRRSVMSCLLWEREFYESGEDIGTRIRALAMAAKPEEIAALAIEARTKFNLRHAPLWLLCALAKTASCTPLLSETIPKVVKRVDELSELVSLYWKANGNDKPLSGQMKKGLAAAFENFNEYHFAKYDRDGAVKLRDVLFMAHPKPKTPEREDLYKRIAERKLVVPDTWEVALSGGADKKATFERLIREGQLGYLALLRNVRNMAEAGCDASLVREAIIARKGADRVLPFRYVAAARACPQFEPAIDQALLACIEGLPEMLGKTAVLVDVSGSMDKKLSAKSDMKRIDAAAALASLIRGDVRVFSFSTQLAEVPPRRGMAGVDAVIKSQPHGGTYLGAAVQGINQAVEYDRLIVVTDEQSADRVPDPKGRGYMINVASAKNGVGYGKWTHIDGFSEAVFAFIRETEAL